MLPSMMMFNNQNVLQFSQNYPGNKIDHELYSIPVVGFGMTSSRSKLG